MSNLRITTLVENTVRKRTLLAEHGLSFWIECGGKAIISDTGHTTVACHNAYELGIDLSKTDAIILSHGHSDHTGGLDHVLKKVNKTKLYTHKESFKPKFSKQSNGDVHDIGMALALDQIQASGIDTCLNDGPVELFPGIHLTGSVPRNTELEDTGGNFYHDQACTVPDMIPDDQTLFIDTPKGTVVILGCAHSGIINTLNYIKKLTAGTPIYAVIGGMHLIHASKERINWTIAELHKFNITHLFPVHCTGFNASAALYHAFSDNCCQAPVGTVIDL